MPVERIELPTFGLQNRCSTAELNRRMKRSVSGETPPHGSDLRRLEYQTCSQRARTSAPALARSNGKKGGQLAAFSVRFGAYWQMCIRPSSPRNQVPGMQTKPLRRA